MSSPQSEPRGLRRLSLGKRRLLALGLFLTRPVVLIAYLRTFAVQQVSDLIIPGAALVVFIAAAIVVNPREVDSQIERFRRDGYLQATQRGQNSPWLPIIFGGVLLAIFLPMLVAWVVDWLGDATQGTASSGVGLGGLAFFGIWVLAGGCVLLRGLVSRRVLKLMASVSARTAARVTIERPRPTLDVERPPFNLRVISELRARRIAKRRFLCTDAAWQAVIRRLCIHVDAVVLDARGYTAKRAGLTWELSHMVELVPAERFVILADITTDMRRVEEALEDAWQTMTADSPNRLRARHVRIINTARDDVAGNYVEGEDGGARNQTYRASRIFEYRADPAREADREVSPTNRSEPHR